MVLLSSWQVNVEQRAASAERFFANPPRGDAKQTLENRRAVALAPTRRKALRQSNGARAHYATRPRAGPEERREERFLNRIQRLAAHWGSLKSYPLHVPLLGDQNHVVRKKSIYTACQIYRLGAQWAAVEQFISKCQLPAC